MTIAALAALLHETAEHHDPYEQSSPPHDWWDWYAAYIDARQSGSSPQRGLRGRRPLHGRGQARNRLPQLTQRRRATDQRPGPTPGLSSSSAGLSEDVCGLVYGLVTIIGLLHGEHALGFIAGNGADNSLHLLLGGPASCPRCSPSAATTATPPSPRAGTRAPLTAGASERFDARDREFRGWRGARSARRTARNRR